MSHHEEEKHEEVEMHGIEGSVENGIESEEQENLENMSNHEEEKHEKEKEELSIEAIFANKEVPSWEKQLTVRALVVSLVMSVVFSFITMNLNLTTGIIPSLNISAGLLGFFFVKTWTKLLDKCGFLKQPFTRQENTVIQTCVVAASGMAFSGGFGSYLFAMSERVIKQSEGGNTGYSYKNLTLGWMIGFLLLVGFRGLFTMVPLRKILVIDLKLPYPSGTATAHLINSFHTPEGAKIAKKQVRELGKFFSFSFLWGFFQWFFTAENDCGFASFPTFGLKAYQYRFYFDFSATYVGVGMICPHVTNLSVLVGGILSWGVMWPLIETKSGDWYPKGLSHSSLQGLQGYKVFIGTAMILGDGLYYFFKVLSQTIAGLVNKIRERDANMHLIKAITGLVTKIRERDANMHLPVADFPPPTVRPLSYDDQCRTKLFLKEQIPIWFAVVGYLIISSISALILPHLIQQLKWYYITAIYVFAPVLAFCNAFGCGLTDWSLASSYGKLAIFTIGAWAGASHGGVLVGLASCGVMMNIVSTASDLMQDFKTGYLTLTSPRSMFVSQLIGTAIGCVIGPCVFWIFYKAFPDLGMPGSTYPAPFATVYYNLAKLGVEGFSALPKNCLNLSYAFFSAAILINIIKDVMGQNRRQFIPIPTAMAIPFYIGSYFAIDMCVGSLIVYIWQRINKTKANAFAPAVASGLICGDGIWTLPASILAIAGVKPPLCMKFLSRRTNNKVDTFLGGLG